MSPSATGGKKTSKSSPRKSTPPKLLILGAGGHGRVVAFTARAMKRWAEVAFLDDRFWDRRSLRGDEKVDGVPLVGALKAASTLVGEYADAVVAMGDSEKRLRLLKKLQDWGFNLPVITHPSAAVSEHASIGAGTVVFAHAVIHPGATLGRGCIVNTAATVDHDCSIGVGVHLSPGVHLGGGVTVGDLSWLGLGAVVRNGVIIGEEVTIGAGAAVVTHVPDLVTALGVPARVAPSADAELDIDGSEPEPQLPL